MLWEIHLGESGSNRPLLEDLAGSLLVPTIVQSIYIFHQHTSIFINRGVDCSRNGFCKDGRCFCGFGFTGKNCETDVNATQARIWDLEQKLNQVENDKRLCERQLMINLQPNQINSTDEVLKLGVSDTHVLLMNEYIVELNPAKFNILNQILNWIFVANFWIEYFFELNFFVNFWIE